MGNLLKTSKEEILWHITWASCIQSGVHRLALLSSNRAQLETTGCAWWLRGKCESWWRGRERMGWRDLSLRKGSERRNHPAAPAAPSLFPEEAPSRVFSRVLQAAPGNPGIRNIWVPGVPEAPPPRLLHKDTGSHHPSRKSQCSWTLWPPAPQSHHAAEPRPKGRARCEDRTSSHVQGTDRLRSDVGSGLRMLRTQSCSIPGAWRAKATPRASGTVPWGPNPSCFLELCKEMSIEIAKEYYKLL